RIAATATVLALLGMLSLIADSSRPEAGPKPRARVLVFSKTAGFRHDSIPAGIAAIRSLGRGNGFAGTTTDVAAPFTRKYLRRSAAVFFLNPPGDVLPAGQQRAFEGYIRHGGGWVGIHSAADTEYDWPFYGRLLGAYFEQHPAVQPAVVDVID